MCLFWIQIHVSNITGTEPNGSNCSSNASGSSSNKSFSSQYDAFLGENFKRILAVGDLGTDDCKSIVVLHLFFLSLGEDFLIVGLHFTGRKFKVRRSDQEKN